MSKNYCTCGAPPNAPSTLDFHNPACPRVERYRGETAALREEVAKKNETIKALADGLWRSGWIVHGEWHSSRCPQSLPPAAAPCTCEDRRAALRLAGRIP